MALCGTAGDHCCWLGRAGKCRFVEASDEPGFNWRCSLRAELGSWGAVHSDARYLAHVRPALDTCGVVEDCGNWPPPGVKCNTCGEVGA